MTIRFGIDPKDPVKSYLRDMDSYYSNPIHRLFHRKDYKEFLQKKESNECSNASTTENFIPDRRERKL